MINQDYSYTKKYLCVDDFRPIPSSIYIFGSSPEARSYTIANRLQEKYKDIVFIEIQTIKNEKDIILVKNYLEKYDLRKSNSIISFFEKYKSDIVYIDASGLSNRIVASLLNNAILLNQQRCFELKIIYTEPDTYRIHQFAAEGVFNDLSEKIEGIDPLPGFANIVPNTDEMKFIALLGFEGGRFTYLIEEIQPSMDNIIPVVGVPGFRIEYPFVALWGNRVPLEATNSYSNIQYVAANSVVDVFFLLKKILQEMPPNAKITLAPIGTKPHAIAAILFAIKFPKQVEIVYDNPKREITRTDGTSLIIECNINALLSETQ